MRSRINPLYYVVMVLALVIVTILCMCQPVNLAQYVQPTPTSTPWDVPPTPPPEPTPTYACQTYLPLIVSASTCDDDVAPEKTFTDVGSVARFSGFNGLSGTAVVAGLQTMIITSFSFWGGTHASIWLAKWPNLDEPLLKLCDLEPRAYVNETLMYHIPCWMVYGSADFIVIQGDGPYTGVLAAEWFNNDGIPKGVK
jgi:hypothetical protein